MTRIAVAGAGAAGASVAYHLALGGARDVLLVDRDEVAGGATGKAMGGVRQQFSTAAEVELARESIRFFEQLGPPFFLQVGYLFLATSPAGLVELETRMVLQRSLGVPVEPAALPGGVRGDDVAGAVACWRDGVADPPAVTRELVRRAVRLGVELREGTDVAEVDADAFVVACGPWSREVGERLGVSLPIRPLRRQLLETSALDLPPDLPMVVEHETGFHFRRAGDRLVLAMADAEPRWGFEEAVDESVYGDRLARLEHRFPAAAGARIERARVGLYDMTPDAHPILGHVGDAVYCACGFSGHGFMQSPAVGRALAELILSGRSAIDLSPFRLDRFDEGGEVEQAVL
ncbi:MAG: FAD-binding oxidoreductase [Actinobacteria bacterium]|nr:FAD-binding oxidoreductase [Actinomycetota bacterium]